MPDTLPIADLAARRLGYLDNLRSFVIFLVIVTHTMVTYSGLGGWYYKEINTASLNLASRIFSGCTALSARPGSWGSCSSWPPFSPPSPWQNAAPRPLFGKGFSASEFRSLFTCS